MFKNKLIFVFALAVLCGASFAGSVAAKTADAVKVTLNFERNQFSYDESVPVSVAFTNQSKNSVKVLRWLTPFDGVKDDLSSLRLTANRSNTSGLITNVPRRPKRTISL